MNLRLFSVPTLLTAGLLLVLISGFFVTDMYLTGRAIQETSESNVTFVETASSGSSGGSSGNSGTSQAQTPRRGSSGGNNGHGGGGGGGGGSSGGSGGNGGSTDTGEDVGGGVAGNPGGTSQNNQTNTTNTNSTETNSTNATNLPPRALLRATPVSGIAPLTVLFNASGSNDPEGGPLTYSWTLTNGTRISTSISFSRTFSIAGSHGIILTVTDNRSASSTNFTTITVSSPPQASECSNLQDDDSDGFIDMGDPGCSSPSDTSEINSPPVTGNTYYVCNTGGSDSNTGTSPTTPWASFAKAKTQFASLAAGGSILFCKGGTFTATEDSTAAWRNTNCNAANPCMLGSYTPTSGATAKPLIRSTFAGTDGSNAIISLGQTHRGYIIKDLHFRNDATTNNAIWILGSGVSHITIDGITAEGFRTHGIVAQQGPTNIIVRNSLIQNNRGRQGFFGGGNNFLIENNTFINNGGVEGDRDHNLYVAAGGAGIPFRNVTIRNNYLRGSSSTSGSCLGVEIVVHGHSSDLLIEGNYVDDTGIAGDGCWGISVSTGHDEPDESFSNTIIRGNTIVNPGNTGIHINSCPNCIIENNVIIGSQSTALSAISVDSGSNIINQNITIRHNSALLTKDDSTGVWIETLSGTTNRIYANSIHYKGTDGAFKCFSSIPASSAYSTFNYNNCYAPNLGSVTWMNSQGLSAWQSASGKDANSFVGNPQFSSIVVPYSLLPQSGSLLVNKVPNSLASSIDIRGNSRPIGSLADIGAYEF